MVFAFVFIPFFFLLTSTLLMQIEFRNNAWKQVLASGEGLVGPPFLAVSKYTEWKDTVATPAFQRYLADQISSDELAAELTDGWADVAG